jgi:hypothetical protein
MNILRALLIEYAYNGEINMSNSESKKLLIIACMESFWMQTPGFTDQQ